MPPRRGFFERFGLLFILIGIALGVAIGVGYGQTMWLASGGPDRKLAELQEMLRQKSPAERLESEAAALEAQAAAATKEIDELAAAFPPDARTDAAVDTIVARREQVDDLVREAALKRELAEERRRTASDEDRGKAERLRAEIDRVEELAERSRAMQANGEAGVPAMAFEFVDFAGDLFLQVLKLLVVPLIITSMTVGITSLGDIRNVGRIGAYSLLFYLLTTALAVGIGVLLVVTVRPGEGGDDAFTYETARIASAKEATPLSTLLDVFRGREGEAGSGMFPSNLFLAASDTNVLALIVFSIVFGAALTTLGPIGEPVIAFFRGANEAVMKMVHLVMIFAPIGIFGLVAANIARNGGGAEFLGELSRLGWYVMVVAVGLLTHAAALMVVLACFGRNPLRYTVGLSRALLTAGTTSSSNATLPVTMECVIEKNRVSEKTASFVLPLGATVNMNGTALYEAVAAIFIAQSLGIELSFAALLIIFITASLAAIGAAGIPEAGLVTLVMVLTAVGLPASGIGMILAVDWFLDRLRTTVNVYGDAIGAGVIDRMIPEREPARPLPVTAP
jgi:Na+/H+-dicarboxylate symporter